MAGSIALVTCAQFPEGEDAHVLGAALSALDLVPTPGGHGVLELELIEPSLFFQYDQEATACFAAAISGRL